MIINANKLKSISKLVSKDTSRTALTRVCVNEKETVVTDGHLLARFPNTPPTFEDDCYPAGPAINTEITGNILLTPDQINTAVGILPKRPILPILENVQVGNTGDNTPVINAGLPVVQIPDNNENVGPYPDYEQVIPDYTDNKYQFALDAKKLKAVCDLAIKHGNKITNMIRFEVPLTNQELVDVDDNGKSIYKTVPITKLNQAVKFDIPGYDGGGNINGVLMPLRIDDK